MSISAKQKPADKNNFEDKKPFKERYFRMIRKHERKRAFQKQTNIKLIQCNFCLYNFKGIAVEVYLSLWSQKKLHYIFQKSPIVYQELQ